MKGKGARSRLKKRAISNYLFRPFYRTLSAAIMAALLPSKKKRKRARSRLNNRHLPSELLEGILLNLPHKSLVRFSVVSKSWKSMILDDPLFARKHKNRAALLGRRRLAVCMKDLMHDIDAAPLFSLAPKSSDFCMNVAKEEDESSDRIKASVSVFSNAKVDVRDLFLEGKPPRDELWFVEVNKSLLLWNPSMRNIVKVVPDPESPTRYNIYGLAYDSVDDDYKILKIPTAETKTELYSLKHDCWRKIKSFSSDVRPSYNQRRCEFVAGRFHWVGITTAGAPTTTIVSFDLSTEKYGEVAIPDEYEYDEYESDYELAVVTLNGKLCAYENYLNYEDEYEYDGEAGFILWVMEEYRVEKSWTTRLDIIGREYPPLLGGCIACSSPRDMLTPLYLFNNNDLLVKLHARCRYEYDMCILTYRNGNGNGRNGNGNGNGNGEEAKAMKIVRYQDWNRSKEDEHYGYYDDAHAFFYVDSLITHNNFSKNNR